MRNLTGADDLADTLAALPRAVRADLIALWRKAYGDPPPKGLSRRLLEHAVAHHLQMEAHGGLDTASRRTLRTLLRRAEMLPTTAATRRAARQAAPRLGAGVRLIREWNGTTHVVEVAECGYLWSGKRWRSLSAIARAITGAHWSGPRFFGLTGEGAAGAMSRASRPDQGKGR